QVLYNYTIQPPFVQTSTIYYSTMSQLLSSSSVSFPNSVQALDGQGKIPTTMNYSLSIQHSVWGGTVVDLGYVGAVSRHLLWARNLNAIPVGTTFKASSNDPTNNRPLPQSFLSAYQGYNNIT